MALAIVAWFALQKSGYVIKIGAISEAGILRMPTATFLVPLTIAYFLFFIQFVRRSYQSLKSWASKR